MNTDSAYHLTRVSVVDIAGKDAGVIVHNVTTNEVKSLEPDQGRETFITDVRGKTLGHGFLFRTADGLRFVGPAGQSERIVGHVDRYTIREDATPSDCDDQFEALVVSADGLAKLAKSDADFGIGPDHLRSVGLTIHGVNVVAYQVRWLGPASWCVLVPAERAAGLVNAVAAEVTLADEAAFHQVRTAIGFPWYGIDLDETNLPQEADRDPLAVSFTKGCYLGQETVARLDALGQVQKKLVRWSVAGPGASRAQAGSKLVAGEKLVGRLTSVATVDSEVVAIGMARRTHFEPGSEASGEQNAESAAADAFTATVRAGGELT